MVALFAVHAVLLWTARPASAQFSSVSPLPLAVVEQPDATRLAPTVPPEGRPLSRILSASWETRSHWSTATSIGAVSLQAAADPGASSQSSSSNPLTEASVWWGVLVGVVAGIAIAALFHWFRVTVLRRRLRDDIDQLQQKKHKAEAALQVAAERAEKLRGVNETKSTFLKELSYAFRTPLTLTLGPIDNLLEGNYGSLSEDARSQLRLAQRNATRLLWLVNQLLDLAELGTDSLALTPTKDNFASFVTDIAWSFEGLAERRDISLGVETRLEDPTVWFDRDKMEKILANLLTAAFRSADQGGAIQVAVQPVKDDEGDDRVELVVADPGSDASSENGPDSDEMYRRDEHLWKTSDAKTSVGLYLVEELVDLHGGHIHVEGEVGAGVRFVVRLPRHPQGTREAEEEGAGTIPYSLREETVDPVTLSRKALSLELERDADVPATARTEGEVEPNEQDKTTILVIDDNPVLRKLVRSHLEPEFRVKEAEEGATGYSLARSLLPDLVIADVMMPEMDGFELCRKIKQDPDIDHVPVIFLTARADLEDRIEGLDVGADAYLTKPFEPEELIARVDNLIESRRSLRESFREERARRTEEEEMSSKRAESAKEALPPTADDESLRKQIEETIAERLTDPDFGVSELASATALSPSQLRRRMKELYDRTPVQLIRRRRLEAGAQLLGDKPAATIGEVAYAVGFNSQSYFSRSFRKEFGASPSQYRERPERVEV